MGKRQPARNPLGMLRRAIEEDWPAPANLAVDLSAWESPAIVFARHFYAGRSNSGLQPVSVPSSTDLTAAAPLVQALLSIWPDPNQAGRWGRQFAKHVAERQRPHQPPMSLSLAARLFGDVFVVWVGRDRERQARQSASAQREAEERRFKADYLHYLQACEERLRQEEPARYHAFTDRREERRRSLLRVTRNGVQSALLRGFESEAARLEDLRHFFSEEVLDLAGWHARHNHEGATA